MSQVHTSAAERLTDIVSLLRPERPRRWPESLTAAAAAGDIERMQLFIDRGANIEERSMGSASPLAAACGAGELEAVRWLIARGAQLDPPGAAISPMQAALARGDCAVAEALLDAGLPVDHLAWGAIAAASLGRLDVLRWVLGRGLDLDRSYPRLGVLRARALASVKKDADADIARLLKGEIDPGPPPAVPPAASSARTDLPRAAQADRSGLLEEGLDLVRAGGVKAARWKATGAAVTRNELLISFGAGVGVVEIVAALLDAGASPDVAPEGTPPPLFRAAEEAQVEVVRLLLDRGAAPNGPDGKTWVPLVGAVMSGDQDVVRVLLDAGANARAKPAGGRTIADHVRGPYATEIRSLLELRSKDSRDGGSGARRVISRRERS